jgi:hypothetical protein
VDLGYLVRNPSQALNAPQLPASPTLAEPWFAKDRFLAVPGNTATGAVVYDTWSFSYENNSLDEDGNFGSDQGTNGLDDDGQFGPDDVGERETRPPYDKPLRGIQVVLRVYETDARQIRQVRVNQHFLAE